MLSILLNGFLTGFFLQLAIGPIFFYILNITLQRTYIDGLFSVIAVTIVDYIYITLAVLGVGKLLEKPKTKLILGILSSLVLILFGIIMIRSAFQNPMIEITNIVNESNYISSFWSAFILTISSPLTIVFWTGVFASRAIEKGYTKKQLIFFGLAAGLATFIFLGSSVLLLSAIKASIPILLLKLLNIAVGSFLILYGIIRVFKIIMNTSINLRKIY